VGGPPAWGLGGRLNNPRIKLIVFYEELRTASDQDRLAQAKRRKMAIRFGTWNVRSLYRSGSLKTVARKLGKYKLDLVGVQEVRWDKGGTERAEDYTFFYGVRNEDHQLGTVYFYIRESYQQSEG
jgi:hypothetical protein